MSHEIQAGAPLLPPFIGSYNLGLWSNADSSRRLAKAHFNATNDPGVFTERVDMCLHTGTHIDALGHFTCGEEMFNGWLYPTNTNNWGLEKLGMEHMPPMITRGVVLDVSGKDGSDFLEGGVVISKKDLQAACEKAKVELEPGDVVINPHRLGRYFMENNDKYTESEPGIEEEGAQWLTEQKVCAIGTDSMAVEVLPHPTPGMVFPVHQHALVEAGVHLIENLALDAIVKAAVSTFCFVLLPVKFTGATGCPVRPVALILTFVTTQSRVRRPTRGASLTAREKAMIVAYIQFPTGGASAEKMADLMKGSAPKYAAMSGLIRKYYLLSEDASMAGGVYLWDSKAEAETVYNNQWRASSRTATAPSP